MKRVLLSLTLLVALSLSAMSQAVVFSDNFDSYTAGDQLASQNPVNWTTWSNAPGSAEDPYISTDQSISNPNSVIIQGTNDCVLLLGDKTQGKYNLKFNMYIPSGYLGYFNVLHLFAGASSEWGLQVYFDQGGIGLVDGGGAGAGAFTFGYDQWIDVKVFVDLDEDWCDFYVNGNLVIGYQWSLGTFGTPGLNQLAAANFYAWNVGASPKYYIENVVYEAVTSSLLAEDFEGYTVGEQLVEQAVAQGLDYWTTWSNSPGSAEDPYISSEYAHGGTKSVVCQGTNDFVMLFGDKTSGKYSVDFYLYIPSGKVGYYNILQAFAGSNSTWGLEIYYNPGGIAEVTADGTTGVAVFNYSYDTWIYMENIVDLNNDQATLKADGVEILTWQWSVGASGGGINQLSAMDIYAATNNGTPYFFTDDISLTELEAPYGPPIITVSPASLSATLPSGGTSEETITIGNEGIADLEWSAYVQFPTLKSSPIANQVIENAVITKPVVNPEFGFVKTEITPGINHTDETVTIHYDGDNATSVGLTSGGTFQVGAMYPADMTADYIGMEITEVEVFVGDAVTAATLMIYGHGSPDTPGQLLGQQNFNPAVDVWTTIVLTDPIMISGGDIWVTYSCTHAASLFPAGGDAGPPIANGDWFKSGASWVPMHIANPAILLNWNIRAVADGNPMGSWLSISPVSGELTTGQDQDMAVSFDAGDLANGTYTANIIIISNDPATPTKTVPVTLTVSGIQLDPPTNLVSDVIGNDVSLTWQAPGFFQPQWLTYSGEVITNSIGTNAAANFDVAARYEPDQLSGFPDGSLTKIMFVPGEASTMCTYTLKIWQGAIPPTLIYSQVVTNITADAWNEITLDSPVAFDNTEVLWFGFNCNATGGYPAGCDDGPQVEGFGNMIYWSGAWTTLTGLNSTLTFNWAVKGYVESSKGTFELKPVQENNTITPSIGTLALCPEKINPPAVSPVIPVRGLLGYNVYRNNVKINSSVVTATEYVDNNLSFGTYTYYVTAVYDEGESGPSNTVTEVITGINEVENGLVSIYPNPSNGLVNIESPSTINSVRMMNYTGQVVYQSATPVNQLRINTADMPAGVYFLMIETGSGMVNQKLVVK